MELNEFRAHHSLTKTVLNVQEHTTFFIVVATVLIVIAPVIIVTTDAINGANLQ